MSVTYFGLRGNLADDCVGPIYRRTQSQAGCCRAALQLDQRGEQAGHADHGCYHPAEVRIQAGVEATDFLEIFA